MGLFDRKRTPDVDVKQQQQASAPQSEPAPAAKEEPAPAPAPAAEKVVVAPAKPAEPAKPSYGIQNAIELMRQLPDDNVPLVVEVVKKTLESLEVDVPSIIEDAERRHARIENRVDGLRQEITDFEDEIAARKQEIEALTADRDETLMVRDRLEMALARATGKNGKASAATTSSAGSSSAGAISSDKASESSSGLTAPEIKKPDAKSPSSWGSQLAAQAKR